MEKNSTGILLESGTNELEIIEFRIGTGLYGINVAKVREIVNPTRVVSLPRSHPHVEGIINNRGQILSLVNLPVVLGEPDNNNPGQERFIITQFNTMFSAFRVHEVTRIHRFSWKLIEKPTDLMQGHEGIATGIVKLNDRLIVLLDFEKIVLDINSEISIHAHNIKDLGERRVSSEPVVIAEDSPTLRQLLVDVLKEAGYQNLRILNDGQEAWNYLENLANELGDQFSKEVRLVITDIEMPQMDGHHLTKRIKEHPRLRQLPVVIFSSLISEDIMHKGRAVGADAQVSKPEIDKLVGIVDKLIG